MDNAMRFHLPDVCSGVSSCDAKIAGRREGEGNPDMFSFNTQTHGIIFSLLIGL